MRGISVIICCYNSELRLPPTLEHLRQQVIDATIPWELIIVDNNSSDLTSAIANEFAASSKNVDCKVVEEKQAGLSHARKKGFDISRYEYLLYCDDDNWLDPSYLQRAFEILEANPKVAVLGGCGEPVCEITPPYWFDDYKTFYATGPQGKTNGDVTDAKGYVYGAGSIYRKSAMQSLFNKGFVSLLEDRKGNSLSSGGDVELCKALKICGYRIWYDGGLTFKHFIPAQRLTWEYIQKMHKGYLVSQSVITAYSYLEKKKRSFWKLWIHEIAIRTYIWCKTILRYPDFKKQNKIYKYRLTIDYKFNCIMGLFIKLFAIRKNAMIIKRSSWYVEQNFKNYHG